MNRRTFLLRSLAVAPALVAPSQLWPFRKIFLPAAVTRESLEYYASTYLTDASMWTSMLGVKEFLWDPQAIRPNSIHLGNFVAADLMVTADDGKGNLAYMVAPPPVTFNKKKDPSEQRVIDLSQSGFKADEVLLPPPDFSGYTPLPEGLRCGVFEPKWEKRYDL